VSDHIFAQRAESRTKLRKTIEHGARSRNLSWTIHAHRGVCWHWWWALGLWAGWRLFMSIARLWKPLPPSITAIEGLPGPASARLPIPPTPTSPSMPMSPPRVQDALQKVHQGFADKISAHEILENSRAITPRFCLEGR